MAFRRMGDGEAIEETEKILGCFRFGLGHEFADRALLQGLADARSAEWEYIP